MRFLWVTVVVLLLALLAGTWVVSAKQSSPGLRVEDVTVAVRDAHGGEAAPDEKYLEPLAEAEHRVITGVGVPTPFDAIGIMRTAPIMEYAWDFDSDGVIDFRSDDVSHATWSYSRAGTYIATFYVFDMYGEYGSVEIPVTVDVGVQEVQYAPFYEPMQFWGLEEKRRMAPQLALDDPAATFFLLVADQEDRYWENITNAYHYIVDSFAVHDSLIVLVSRHPSDSAKNLQDTLSIDFAKLDSAYNFLYSRMTSNDQLHIMHSGHGSGYTDSSTCTYGDTATYYKPHLMSPNSVNIDNGDPDIDQIESEFAMFYHDEWGESKNLVGMNTWAIHRSYSGLAFRKKLVSTFSGMTFINDTLTVSDTDIYVEEIRQYIVGDTNYNLRLDDGECWDCDGDGNPPCTLIAGSWVLDEDDWGDYRLQFDRSHSGVEHGSTPGRYTGCIVFDDGFDGYADFDFACTDTSNPVVDATDIDNDGLIIGIDFNGDGDKLDSVGCDEKGFSGSDDGAALFLDSLEYSHVSYVLLGCHSGGYIDDLSRDNVVISTATTSGTVSWGEGFTRHMTKGLTGIDGSSNPNADRVATFKEVFNNIDGDGRERLDDNGDRVGHSYTLPSGGDGYFADSVAWGTLPDPAPVPILVSPLQDTLHTTVPTFVWSDTGTADSFAVSFSGLSGGGRYQTTDTTFTVPDSGRIGLLLRDPLTYSWEVVAYRGLARTPSGSAVDSFSIVADYSCCTGMRGNVNGDTADAVTITDLQRLAWFVNGTDISELPCYPEANVDGDYNEIPDIDDYYYLLDYLFQYGPAPVNCDD